MKRAFASAVAFALAVAALSAAAALVLQLGALKSASSVSLDATRLGWRFSDSTGILARVADDAVLDAAYQSCGCSNNNASAFNSTLQSTVKTYLSNATIFLTDVFYSASIDKINAGYVSASSCNFSATTLISGVLTVRSPNAVRTENVSFARSIHFSKQNASVTLNLTQPALARAYVTVGCG